MSMDPANDTMSIVDGQSSRNGMRAADADRERVAEQLRSAHADGRLDLTEYDERVQQAWAARTYGDLDALTVDLPQARPSTPTVSSEVRRSHQWRRQSPGRREPDQPGDLGGGVPVHYELDLSLVDLGRGSVGCGALGPLGRRTGQRFRRSAVTDPGPVWTDG
jgi:hypothetical protein